MNVTYYGHACFQVEIGGKKVLFDPFITPNEKAAHIDVNSINPDYIFLSHGHQDHVADAIDIAKRSGAAVFAPYETATWIGEQGVENANPFNHGGWAPTDFGRVKMTAAVHSSVLPDGTYGGNPAGYVMESAEGTFYYAGDTALTLDMQLIPMTCKPLDFAILPVGDYFTMGVEDAILASDFIKCNKVIGMHFDTWPPLEIDHDKAKQAFSAKGKELTLMGIGETISL